MAKIKRMINMGIPVTACNMRCSYCYVSEAGWRTDDLGHLDYPPEHIQRCLTQERTGGVCHVNICGSGETLLPDYAMDLIRRMLENGHYVSVATNGTLTKRLEELCALPEEYKERLFIKFSFHFLELKRLKLIDRFFSNICLVRDNGCSFSVELGADDDYVPYVEQIRALCRERLGADCHVIELRHQKDEFDRLTKLPLEERNELWGQFHSELFDYQQTEWGRKRCEFCYAGEWLLQLDGKTGWAYPCFIGGNDIQNIFADPEEPIRFVAIGENCPWAHCYPCHVLLTSGIIPELEAPTYYDVRDREAADGSHWLKPKMAEFFSSKFIDANQEYSPEKKAYINGLMALEYKNRGRLLEMEDARRAAEKSLLARGIHTVAVWGANMYSDWLLALLLPTKIRVQYMVDPDVAPSPKRRAGRGGSALPPVLSRFDDLPRADAAVITDYARYTEIKTTVPPVYGRLLSITELADEEGAER